MKPKIASPEYLTFACPLTVEAAETEKSAPRFRMVAYTGGTMRITGFPHPVVVDLEGLAIERQEIPIRLDHNPRQGVGHTQNVAVKDGQIIAEGLISRDTSWARDVTRSAANGFPWQASIGAAVVDAEFVPNGISVTVNGRTFQGPIHVVRRSILKEISFVDSGADSSTSAQVAAEAKETQLMGDQKEMNKDVMHDDYGQAIGDDDGNAKKEKEVQPKETNEQPAAKEPTPENITASATEADPVVDYRKRVAAEARRIEAIRKVCAGKYPDIEAKAIEEGWDETRTELHVLRASRPKAPSVAVPKRPSGPEVFEAIALMASGMPVPKIEAAYAAPVLEAADKLRGIGIQEFCELACGQQLPRFRRDATGWLQAAFSTTSLPGILSNIANKMLLEGYNYVEDAWRSVCKIASVNDFKEHSRYRMTGSFKFEQVGPDGELKHGKLDEQTYGQKAATHGIMFALTRQMIINDDMGAFTDIPRQIGMGAAEAIADGVWTLLLSNPAQSDGEDFFSVAHKNYIDGADSALSIDALTAAEVKFGEQTKPNGKPLGMF